MVIEPFSRGSRAAREGGFGSRSLLMLFMMLGCTDLAVPARASAEEQESDPTAAVSADEFARPTDEALAERIDTIIALIGSPDYELRTSASEELISIGGFRIRSSRSIGSAS